MATAIAALSDLEQKKLTAVMEMAKPECAGEIRELAKNLELFEFAPKVRTPAEYGRYCRSVDFANISRKRDLESILETVNEVHSDMEPPEAPEQESTQGGITLR